MNDGSHHMDSSKPVTGSAEAFLSEMEKQRLEADLQEAEKAYVATQEDVDFMENAVEQASGLLKLAEAQAGQVAVNVVDQEEHHKKALTAIENTRLNLRNLQGMLQHSRKSLRDYGNKFADDLSAKIQRLEKERESADVRQGESTDRAIEMDETERSSGIVSFGLESALLGDDIDTAKNKLDALQKELAKNTDQIALYEEQQNGQENPDYDPFAGDAGDEGSLLTPKQQPESNPETKLKIDTILKTQLMTQGKQQEADALARAIMLEANSLLSLKDSLDRDFGDSDYRIDLPMEKPDESEQSEPQDTDSAFKRAWSWVRGLGSKRAETPQVPEPVAQKEYISIQSQELIKLVNAKIEGSAVDMSNLPQWLQDIMEDVVYPGTKQL